MTKRALLVSALLVSKVLVSAMIAGSLMGCTENSVNRILEPPLVTVLSPAPGALLRQSEEATLIEAVVEDSYDAPEELEVLWSVGELSGLALADAEGHVRFGVATDVLPLGELTITVVAVDSDGDQGEDSVTVTLGGPLSPPEVSILEPGDGVVIAEGEQLVFRGEAFDLTTPAGELDFSWSSDLQGELEGAITGGGESALITAALIEGLHTVTLTVVDADGDMGEDSVQVQVGWPGDVIVDDAEPGDLVFSEMMINPELVEDEVGEWVELYNTAGYGVDVGGYSFHDDDNDLYVLEGSIVVQPGGYLVLCASMDFNDNGGVRCDGWFRRDSQGEGLALANREDEVVLSRPDGVEIDWLHYDGDWFTPGIAIGVDPDLLDSGANDDPAHWCDQVSVMNSGEFGTPGAPNDRCD